MKRQFLSFFASCVLIMAAAGSASAAGFALYEWSARGNALGGTLVGRADDPSAVAFNPAGITQLDGTQVAFGASFAHPICEVETEKSGVVTTSKSDNGIFVIPQFYVTHKLNDKWSAGFGEFSRFGLGFEYHDDWPGAFNVYEATIKSVSLNPNIAYQVTDRLSVAVGVEYVYVDLNIKNKYNTGLPPADSPSSELSADGDGTALTAGIHYKLDNWRFGFGYHSQAKIDASGDTTVSGMTGGKAVLNGAHKTTGSVVLPDMLSFGIACYPTKNLSVEVGAIHTRWSTYTDLDLDIETLGPHPQPKNSDDVWRYNIGVEYGVTDNWDLRASYCFDEAPEDQMYVDYMIPASDRHLIGVGTGYTFGAWTVDLAYTYIKAEKVNYDKAVTPINGILPGTSKNGVTHMGAVTMGYVF
ncbi:OmpP1/FadL family transporter [Desulfoluna spongiiphila]|uniref:OmpP1/FadL family transporter n=1 Tax=Desulfoluna spongiiphila TaxID=419481 RepID=UPI001253440F|nr:TonB-dependent receptor [Desulfoluna spongiiphila]VVS94159.1 outer membrane protein transport protein (ompp1/fadl/todx) [Desulfoluna spongiiphila]